MASQDIDSKLQEIGALQSKGEVEKALSILEALEEQHPEDERVREARANLPKTTPAEDQIKDDIDAFFESESAPAGVSGRSPNRSISVPRIA